VHISDATAPPPACRELLTGVSVWSSVTGMPASIGTARAYCGLRPYE
jgi:hypothetical protein